jgi:O-antigen ligase
MQRGSSAAEICAAGGAIFSVAAAWLAIDPRSIDGFYALKSLLVAAGLSLAALGALGSRLRAAPARLLPPPGPRRAALGLLLVGLLGALVCALSSRRPGQSLDALRSAAFLMLALPVGTSGAIARHRGKLLAVFFFGAAANAVLVLLAAFKIYSPVTVEGEFETAALGGLIGNPGHLGIALSLAAVTALAGLSAPGVVLRVGAGALILLCAAGMLATQTLTGLISAAAGIAAFALFRYRRRAWPFLAGAILLASLTLLVAPVRWRLGRMTEAIRQGDWNKALTARGAPWLAAAEMIRQHPLLGIGPGNFGSEFIPARLDAEARFHRHLVLPGMRTNSFSQAHNDYLDIAAAIGIPLSACVAAAFLVLLVGLAKRSPADPEAAVVAAVLSTGAVAALSWFPFQIVTSGLWLLLAAGRGFRLIEAPE